MKMAKNNQPPLGTKPTVKNPGKILKRVIGYVFESYKIHMIFVMIFIVISALTSVVSALFIKQLIDEYITPIIAGNKTFAELFTALCTMAVIYIVGTLSTWAYNRIMVTVTQGTLRNVRKDIFSHMETLPIKYFDQTAHGDIMSIYTNDTDTLRQLVSQSLPQIFSSAITIVSVLISMISLSLPLTGVTLLMVAIMLVTTKKIASKSGMYFIKQQKSIGKLNGYIEEMMEGQKVVKVFCHEEESKAKFDELNQELFESADNANKFANILMPINANIGNISYVLTAVVGAAIAIATGGKALTLGAIASFLTLNKNFTMPVNQVSQQLNSIVQALAGADRIFKIIDEKPELDDGYVELVRAKYNDKGEIEPTEKRTGMWAWKHYHKESDTTTYQKLEGDVVLDGVDFGYTDDKIVLHDIKLYAKPGQKIAFVGATGAGKTTITNLINRFYDIQDGKIRYDGININKIKKADLRRSLGIVLQDTNLFTGTVMENIRYGRLDATDEEVIEAAKLANADFFIRHLPDGYNTMLKSNASNLSQGQRQLLSIARAAVANPPVLILDEATSSIDTRTEKIVQDGMDKLMQGRTVFVIAHRLSTIKNSDVIMVLDHGRIIERGNHDSLIAEKGIYYQLYTGAIEQD
jgi:ATP-binding cassette subfamily B protein